MDKTKPVIISIDDIAAYEEGLLLSHDFTMIKLLRDIYADLRSIKERIHAVRMIVMAFKFWMEEFSLILI